PGTEAGQAEATRASYAAEELKQIVTELAGPRGHARVVVDPDPAMAIVRAAEDAEADVLVVGNAGMAGRKEFLLGNVPNRISHNARCTVIIVNTALLDGDRKAPAAMHGVHIVPSREKEELETAENAPLMGRATRIAGVM